MKLIDKLTDAGLFSRNAPRYTSYPTAPQFHGGVSQESFQSWVELLPDTSQISLYVHIPFCERLCWFCACRTQGVRSQSPVDNYLQHLHQEIDKLAASLPRGVSIARMHWGGGSPTILQPQQIESLAAKLAEVAPNNPDWEFSVEIDPTSVDEAKLDAFAAAGMNRASIGIQDFDEKVQTAIGREQSFEITHKVITGLRKRGIASINADIVYGLPFQNTNNLANTLNQVIELDPDRVALFGYAHVPWMAKRQRMISEDSLPSPLERFDLFNQAYSALSKSGLTPLGIDHFAKPNDSLAIAASTGHLRRNFQGYTDDRCAALIGLGASSISRFEQGYIQNRASTAAYLNAIKSDKWASERGIALTLEDKIRARAIEMLMCEFSVDLQELINHFGDFAEYIRSDVIHIAKSYPEFTEFDGNLLRINEDGFHMCRLLACELDAYLTSASKHSQAI